jgi:hypothetical protein
MLGQLVRIVESGKAYFTYVDTDLTGVDSYVSADPYFTLRIFILVCGSLFYICGSLFYTTDPYISVWILILRLWIFTLHVWILILDMWILILHY